MDFYTLSNGVKIPKIGYGTFRITDLDICTVSVKEALKTGYTHIDGAAIYKNETAVGKGIHEFLNETKTPREELFITSKVWNAEQGFESTLKAFEASLKDLGLDYIDLYLVHWPNTENMETTIETWKALEKLYADGKVKAIGVCNFNIHHFETLLPHCKVKPMINQIELHPLLQQKEVRAFCKEHGILVEAWAPLMQGNNLDNPVITEIAAKHGKTNAQVLIRWSLESGILPLPKSTHPERMKQNLDVFNFNLDSEDMEKIAALDEGKRFGSNPDKNTLF